MGVFFYILSHNIIPIFLLISLGFIIAKKFEIQILSLTKLMFYLFRKLQVQVEHFGKVEQ